MTGYGPVIRRGIESRGLKISTVINTHHHYDHTGGNNAFIGDGTIAVLAHAKALPRILGNVDRYTSGAAGAVRDFEKVATDEGKAAAADAKTLIEKAADLSNDNIAAMFRPTADVGNASSTKFGSVMVSLTHVGAGHTDNDLLVFLPELNVLHTGDLLFNKVWPFVDRAGGCDTKGWITSLERAFNMCSKKTMVIPGHGDITDREAITRQIAFFKDMREQAAKAVAAGTPRDEFLKIQPDAYKDYALADWIKPITLGGLWDEAKGVPVA
jgi:glyoxylase-like metal-dependent hydrolase (beta-lactamase superfamily II)